jgi:hypothetical protein
LTDFLTTGSSPDVNCWLWTRLSSDHCFAVSTDVNRENIISVEGLVNGILVFRRHWYFSTSIEALLAVVGVHDNAEGCNHVDCLAFTGIPQILLAVGGSISVYVLDFKLDTGRIFAATLDFLGHCGFFQIEVAPSWCHTLLASME